MHASSGLQTEVAADKRKLSGLLPAAEIIGCWVHACRPFCGRGKSHYNATTSHAYAECAQYTLDGNDNDKRGP
jgi:hypothetical protein